MNIVTTNLNGIRAGRKWFDGLRYEGKRALQSNFQLLGCMVQLETVDPGFADGVQLALDHWTIDVEEVEKVCESLDHSEVSELVDDWSCNMFEREECGYWMDLVCQRGFSLVFEMEDDAFGSLDDDAKESFRFLPSDWEKRSGQVFFENENLPGYFYFCRHEVARRAVGLFLSDCAKSAYERVRPPSQNMDPYIQRAIFGKVKYG